MTDMGQHSAGKGGSLRRAWISAWIVVLAMGGTTMSFQVYHSVTKGQMPWALAVLYGIVPLLIAMLVLEIVAEWHASSWVAKAVAYLIMGGSMFLSASATGAVVLYAAPPHSSLLFGALLDAAELLAAYFIMNGPRATDSAADAAAIAAGEAEKLAAHEAALSAERDARTAAEAERNAARQLADDAAQRAADATAQAEILTRKLATVSARNARAKKPASSGRSKAAISPATKVPNDVDAQAEALAILAAEPGISGAKLGERVGKSDRWGQLFLKGLAAKSAGPQDSES